MYIINKIDFLKIMIYKNIIKMPFSFFFLLIFLHINTLLMNTSYSLKIF